MKALLGTLSGLAGRVFRAAQRALLPPCLLFAYVFGIGPMALAWRLAALFRRRGPEPGTFWRPAEGYGPEDAETQS